MELNTVFKFVSGTVSYDTADVFLVRVDPGITKTDELLNALYYTLWFPGYFGFNWNALDDCLTDLAWIDESRIVIVHRQLPDIPEVDLKVYLEILRDAVLRWRENDDHQFDVVFAENDRAVIEGLLAA